MLNQQVMAAVAVAAQRTLERYLNEVVAKAAAPRGKKSSLFSLSSQSEGAVLQPLSWSKVPLQKPLLAKALDKSLKRDACKLIRHVLRYTLDRGAGATPSPAAPATQALHAVAAEVASAGPEWFVPYCVALAFPETPKDLFDPAKQLLQVTGTRPALHDELYLQIARHLLFKFRMYREQNYYLL